MLNFRRYKEPIIQMDEYRIDSSAIRIYADPSRNNILLEDPNTGVLTLSELSQGSNVGVYNGLSKSSDNSIGLGGELTQDTSILFGDNSVQLGDSSFGINFTNGINNFLGIYGNSITLSNSAKFGGYNIYIVNSEFDSYISINPNYLGIDLDEEQIGFKDNQKGHVILGVDSSSIYYSQDFSQYYTDRTLPDWGNVKSYIDSSLGSTSSNIDSSLNELYSENDTQDVSISNLQSKDTQIDTSLNELYNENDTQDVSINNIQSTLSTLDSSYVNTSGDTMTGNLYVNTDVSVGGTLYAQNDVEIGGNLVVDGSTTFVDSSRLDVSTNFIKLNTGLTGTPPSTLQSGIEVGRGDLDPYVFLFDEGTETFNIGIAPYDASSDTYSDASIQAVATRENTPQSNGIPYWNTTETRYDTSANLTTSTIVKKYSESFDGTAGTSHTVLATTHKLGTGPFHISVFDSSTLVYPETSFNGNGDVTVSWESGSLSTDCLVFITG